MKNVTSDYKIYIYYIEEVQEYLLFKPTIHKWLVLDEIGADIVRIINEDKGLDKLENRLIKKYKIDTEIFQTEVMPFVNRLIKEKFYRFKEYGDMHQKDCKWISNQKIKISRQNYPYNNVIISLGDRCNLDCIYCFNKNERKKNHFNDVNIDTILKFMKEYRNNRGNGVIFTGGEPTLNTNLELLCSKAKEIGLETGIITNGYKINQLNNLERICENLDSITISYDSVEEKELKELWNVQIEGKLDGIYEGFEKINKVSKRKRLKVIIAPIVSKLNLNSLDKLVIEMNKLFKDCDLKFNFSRYMPLNAEVDKRLEITEKEYIDTYKKAFSSRNKDILLEWDALSHGGRYIPYCIPNLYVCKPSMFINSCGEVYPCQNLLGENWYLGNINQEEFDSINKKFLSKIGECCLVHQSRCAKCELRFVCGNKSGICGLRDNSGCKKKTLYQMYLQAKFEL